MSIDKLHKKLIKKKITISVAESCTGGLLSGKLTKLTQEDIYLLGFSRMVSIKHR